MPIIIDLTPIKSLDNLAYKAGQSIVTAGAAGQTFQAGQQNVGYGAAGAQDAINFAQQQRLLGQQQQQQQSALGQLFESFEPQPVGTGMTAMRTPFIGFQTPPRAAQQAAYSRASAVGAKIPSYVDDMMSGKAQQDAAAAIDRSRRAQAYVNNIQSLIQQRARGPAPTRSVRDLSQAISSMTLPPASIPSLQTQYVDDPTTAKIERIAKPPRLEDVKAVQQVKQAAALAAQQMDYATLRERYFSYRRGGVQPDVIEPMLARMVEYENQALQLYSANIASITDDAQAAELIEQAATQLGMTPDDFMYAVQQAAHRQTYQQ